MGTLNIAPVTPLDYRRLAEKRLPRFLFDYIDGGANDELTMAANINDFQKLHLRQRVMRDVSNISTETVILGEKANMPVILAPVGMAGLMARRGEAQGVRAANSAGVPFTLSTVGICPLEEIKAASSKPFWFQLYMIRDREIVRNMLTRAQAAGCTTLVFTVDLPIAGMRHRDARNGMGGHSLRARAASAWQIMTHPIWVADVGVFGKPHSFGNLEDMVANPTDMEAYKNWLNAQFDCSVTWKDIEWLRGIWPGKLLIKGILDAEDAIAAAAAGADGVIVSNHGGRQLDTVASGISKLPSVVAAVGDRIEVLMDGGVRSGLDVVKAVALGARAVMIGRPWVWANAAHGQTGVSNLLAVFKREMEVAMALTGVTRVDQLSPDLFDRDV